MYFHELIRETGIPQSYRRWSQYSAIRLPSFESFARVCHIKTALCLCAHAQYANLVSRRARTTAYKTIESLHTTLIPGVGSLTARHSMALQSEIGMVPFWVRWYANMDPSSRVVKQINDSLRDEECLTASSLNSFMETLTTRLRNVLGRRCNHAYTENVLCKYYRSRNQASNDTRWCDTLIPGQTLFRFEEERIFILGPNGSENYAGCLINHFPYGDELVPALLMAQRSGGETVRLKRNTPADELLGIHVPDAVRNPTRELEYEFELGQMPPLENEANHILRRALRSLRI